MTVANVVHVVAMEIHGAAAGGVLNPDALRLDDGVEARRGDRLTQKKTLIVGKQCLRFRVEVFLGPRTPLRRQIGVALGFFRSSHRGLSSRASGARPGTDLSLCRLLPGSRLSRCALGRDDSGIYL